MKNESKNIDKDTLLAKWLANEISDIDFKKLVSEKDFIAFQKIKKGIEAFEVIEKPLENSFKEIEAKIQDKNTSKVIHLYKKWAFSIAASLLLLIGLNYFFKSNTIQYKTRIGEQRTIALLDGSEVILNANSQLYFNKKNWKNKREVYLKGEAFFKVKKGNNFTVKTKNGSVTVLGTQFTVTSFSDFFKVQCFSGKVKVTQSKIEKILLPNQKFLKINGNSIVLTNINNTAPYWIKGETIFNSTPSKYVFMALKDQYGLDFKYPKSIENELFTGVFPNKDIKTAVKIISDALQLKYTINKNTVILEKK